VRSQQTKRVDTKKQTQYREHFQAIALNKVPTAVNSFNGYAAVLTNSGNDNTWVKRLAPRI
tara:strand:- start:539 stop:721 length:183 start_codon:yes stop_codon:yes gene_type:complete